MDGTRPQWGIKVNWPAAQPWLEELEIADTRRPTMICFSHLRWNFVYQRPQHLMSRFARDFRLIFFEEPIEAEELTPRLETYRVAGTITVVVPRLPVGWRGARAENAQRFLLDRLLATENVEGLVVWYYTPMSFAFSSHLPATCVIYDCMDELSAFDGAPPELALRERALVNRANVLFAGGHQLYELKRNLHPNAHAFPSSVDVAHFAQARGALLPPQDQKEIPGPRLGFYGVIDERFDTELVERLADRRPEWHFVLVGPVVKIDPARLPRRDNIHYLGIKAYSDLPRYLAGWDVALMPFALNRATRFISPTKTPEFLAAGRPVVSTPIADVVRSYADTGLVRIARTAEEFEGAIEASLKCADRNGEFLEAADRLLSDTSWDQTWTGMREILRCAV